MSKTHTNEKQCKLRDQIVNDLGTGEKFQNEANLGAYAFLPSSSLKRENVVLFALVKFRGS